MVYYHLLHQDDDVVEMQDYSSFFVLNYMSIKFFYPHLTKSRNWFLMMCKKCKTKVAISIYIWVQNAENINSMVTISCFVDERLWV